MRIVSSFLGLAAIVGCAAQPPAPVAVAQADTTVAASRTTTDKQVCRKETVVGSNFPVTVCHGGGVDPNDPDVQRNLDEMNRTNGLQQSQLSRSGVNR